MKAITTLIIAALLSTGSVQACDMVGAYIINLSQDEIDKSSNCLRFDTDIQVQTCVQQLLQDNIPAECRANVDIFVPGSNQEFGAWKQFNHIFNSDNDRAHISLQYEDAREADNDLLDLDPAKYDQGVIDAMNSLRALLDTIQRFNTNETIRVFGHSKGSHAVALTADLNGYDDVAFYAFAQAARTAVDISSRSDIRPGKLGRPGYIEKLSDNLVGITWRNDEVQWMVGDGLSAGSQVPEMWGFPGYIKDERTDGTSPIFAEAFRIDHHNNYGGNYTDGLSGNNWREGEGTKGDGWPYCATGDKIAWDSGECDEGNVRFSPWFWGHPECRQEAFRMMKGGDVGDRYYIGYSGPRDRNSCRESQRLIEVEATMRYRWDLPDKDCINKMEVEFQSLDGKKWDSFTVEGTTRNDAEWFVRSWDLVIPHHLLLELDMDLREDNDGGNCNSAGATETELWIDYLRLRFTHPGIGGTVNRSIIGYREGRGTLGTLDNYANTAWRQPGKSSEQYRMYYSSFYNSIKIEVNSESPKKGNFEKRVHLLD